MNFIFDLPIINKLYSDIVTSCFNYSFNIGIFLFEILETRSFGKRFITWIKLTLEGSRICVNLNGTLGPLLLLQKGLRHGDPLSPFLFILVTDALNKILTKAMSEGFVVVLGNFPNMDNILNLHFVDDTLLFLKTDPKVLLHIKWLLLGFENLSGFKLILRKVKCIL